MKNDENLLENENEDELKLFIEKKKSQNEILKKMVNELKKKSTTKNLKNDKQK